MAISDFFLDTHRLFVFFKPVTAQTGEMLNYYLTNEGLTEFLLTRALFLKDLQAADILLDR